MTVRVPVTEAVRVACELLTAAGMDQDAATAVATGLVDADRLGRRTHGLRLLPSYLEEIRSGRMRPDGRPRVVRDEGGPVALWDAEWRSGVWAVHLAVREAADRARRTGVGIISIARTHHIAGLQPYLMEPLEAGLVTFVTCSDPSGATVAPFGGVEAVLQPDPIAIGFPTSEGPVLVDISTSTTANAVVEEAIRDGRRLPGKWVQTADGIPTDDPRVVHAQPPGTLLPAGGADHGHKGYGLAVAIEALTQGLAGYGREGAEDRWGASALVQVTNPAFFAGGEAFDRQAAGLVSRLRGSKPAPGNDAVRVPGDASLRAREEADRLGVALTDATAKELDDECRRARVASPYGRRA